MKLAFLKGFKLEFENPVFNALIILFFASSINDWWAITIGIITPVQAALLYGFFLFLFRYKSDYVNHFIHLRRLIILYLIVVFISTGYVFYNNGYFNLTFVTILINMLWIVSAMPFLSLGFTDRDIVLFFKKMVQILIFISIPVGLYELVTHKTVLSTGYGLSEQVFYIRGLHIDKIEFAFMMAWVIFISIAFWGKKEYGFPNWLMIVLFMTGVLLISVSYSSTALLGVVLGIAGIVFQDNKKAFFILPVAGLLFYLFVELLSNTPMVNDLISSYTLKYDLNVKQSDERNFRTMSWAAAWDEIEESPLIGYGIGSSGKIVQKHFIKNINFFTNEYIDLSKEVNTHNLFFNEMLDFGLLGTIPIFLIIGTGYVYLFRYSRYPESKILKSFIDVLIGISALLVLRFILYYHRFDQTVYIIWICLVLGLKATRINRKES